jgi:hypothetical protein
MRQLVCRGHRRQGAPHHAWPAVIVLTAALVFGHAAHLSASVNDSAPLEMAGEMAFAPADLHFLVSDSVAVEFWRPDTGYSLQATENLSHTTFVPLMSKSEWAGGTNRFGIQIFDIRSETANKAAELEAGWVRVPITWASIEPTNTTPEGYHWSAGFEAWLQQLTDQGIQIILTVNGNPDWAATYRDGPLDKTDPTQLAEFLSAAVARYSIPPYNVRYWELYNEPDNGDEVWASRGLGYWGNDPEAYAQMLAAVYQPMKAANPNVQVVFGGIAYDFWIEEGGPFVSDFLDQVLQHGAGPYFDVMNYHFYPNFGGKWSPYGIGLIGKTNFLRDKLASYGVFKPIICSETGAQSGAFPGGSDEEQSRYVVQAFVRSMAARLDFIVWFMLTDDPGYWKSGLLNVDLSPKPSFYAFQTLVDQLGSADLIRTMGPAESGSDQIEAYAFSTPDSSTQILVAWSQDGVERQMMVETRQVTIVDKYGSETIRRDGDDGTVDNRVQVPIGGSPVYLRLSESVQPSQETTIIP